jgi:hypothetical protein
VSREDGEIFNAEFRCLVDRGGYGGRGGFKPDADENDLAVRIFTGDLESVKGGVDYAYIRTPASLDVQG